MDSTLGLDFRMHAERTPNPQSIKWVLSKPVAEVVAGAHFEQAPSAEVSPLASAVFQVPGVCGVFLGPDFVTVTKDESCEWSDLAQPIVEAVKAWAGGDEPALGPAYEPPQRGEEGAVEERIRRILEEEIRPFVAMDGGEISFAGYRDGVVQVELRGSCSGCPSSTVTLKMGIESRLREAVPEVQEVVAL